MRGSWVPHDPPVPGGHGFGADFRGVMGMNLGIWGQIKGKHKNPVERGVMGTENRNDTLLFALH